MKILDGKNHLRGAYERFSVHRTADLLNTGRHWGFLDHPLAAKRYSQQAIKHASAVFLSTIRDLVDQWIDSGIGEQGENEPFTRDVCWKRAGKSESIFDILKAWMTRHPPQPLLAGTGRICIRENPPSLNQLDPESYASDMAIYYFKDLMDAQSPQRLAHCEKCRTYFVHARAPRKGTTIKFGTFCMNCKSSGGPRRTIASRVQRRKEMVGWAADASPNWKPTPRHGKWEEWIAQQVNKKLPSSHNPITRRWVTLYRKAIEAEVERRNHAKG